MHVKAFALSCLSLLALPVANAFAAAAAGPGAGIEVLSFVGSLLVVIGSILAFGWLYARVRPGMTGNAELIRVVASRPLGAKERLLVVEVSGEQLLVGVSQSGMQTLTTLSTPVEEVTDRAGAANGFARVLRALNREAAQ